jgi:ribose/xylose/arabinose/galactoside ABC-type transport system permease subunit
MTISRATKLSLVSSSMLGVAVGIAMFLVAGEHNPDYEFHGAEWSSVASWAFIGIAWFAAIFAVSCAVFWILLRLFSRGGKV